MHKGLTTLLALCAMGALLPACKGKPKPAATAGDGGAVVAVTAAQPDASKPVERAAEPHGDFAEWLRAHLPPNAGALVAASDGALTVVHTVAQGDTALSIAKAYLDLTDIYRAKDLAAEITKSADLAPGAKVTIPHLLKAPYEDPDKGRMGWPQDRALRGVFITGAFAGIFWPETIEKLASRNLNAIVLDGKDYMGPVTYPTQVKVALETQASTEGWGKEQSPPIPDLKRAIRFAHARGVRIIMRVACFHDPWAAKRASRLSLMGTWGKPFPMGWMDPTNVEAQDYLLDLVKEEIDAGADEIQLDYVRFPVQSRDIKSVVMPAPDGHRSRAMKAFVDRVHELTQSRKVPLSLDIFGVTATGDLSDIEALGQNIGTIGDSAEALSPMVYPSHYSAGYHGFAEPGNHPEIIGIGSRAAVQKLTAVHNTTTIIRPWLQASSYKSSAYGPKYIQDEIKSAEASGAVGWLMWDPENSYWAVWRGVPVVKDTNH
jgi:hypothetical protein